MSEHKTEIGTSADPLDFSSTYAQINELHQQIQAMHVAHAKKKDPTSDAVPPLSPAKLSASGPAYSPSSSPDKAKQQGDHGRFSPTLAALLSAQRNHPSLNQTQGGLQKKTKSPLTSPTKAKPPTAPYSMMGPGHN